MKKTFEEKVNTICDGNDKLYLGMAATGCLSYMETLAETPDEKLRERLNNDFAVWLEVYKRSTGTDWNDLR